MHKHTHTHTFTSTFTFTFSHLADAFIQSDLHMCDLQCIHILHFTLMALLDASDISHVHIACVCPSTTTRAVGPNSSKVRVLLAPGFSGCRPVIDCHAILL